MIFRLRKFNSWGCYFKMKRFDLVREGIVVLFRVPFFGRWHALKLNNWSVSLSLKMICHFLFHLNIFLSLVGLYNFHCRIFPKHLFYALTLQFFFANYRKINSWSSIFFVFSFSFAVRAPQVVNWFLHRENFCFLFWYFLVIRINY